MRDFLSVYYLNVRFNVAFSETANVLQRHVDLLNQINE